MKTLKLLLGLFLLLSSTMMSAQKYMVVHAPLDLHIDLQNSNGKAIGQVFNLEVVYVENEPSSANTRILTHNNFGYIPSNYLKDIPEKYYAQIHRMWSDGALFISSIETPSVLVTVTMSDFKVYDDNGSSFYFNAQGLYVSDLANNKLLDYVLDSPYSIVIGSKSLTLESDYYFYSFYKDSDQRVVRMFTPLYNRIYPAINELEGAEKTLSRAVEAVGSTKVLENHFTDKKSSLAYNEMVRVIGFNNFDFLAKLGRLYADGNRQAEKLYPIVERYFPMDDEQIAKFDEISTKVWGLKNKGRTILN